MRRTLAVQSTCQRPAPKPRVPSGSPALTGIRWVCALHGRTPALDRLSEPGSGILCRHPHPLANLWSSVTEIGSAHPSGRDAPDTFGRGCSGRGFVNSRDLPSPKNLPLSRGLAALCHTEAGMTRPDATLGVVSPAQASPDRASARPRRQPQPPTHSCTQRRSQDSAVNTQYGHTNERSNLARGGAFHPLRLLGRPSCER